MPKWSAPWCLPPQLKCGLHLLSKETKVLPGQSAFRRGSQHFLPKSCRSHGLHSCVTCFAYVAHLDMHVVLYEVKHSHCNSAHSASQPPPSKSQVHSCMAAWSCCNCPNRSTAYNSLAALPPARAPGPIAHQGWLQQHCVDNIASACKGADTS